MNLIRITLSALYVLLMVLSHWAHPPSKGHSAEDHVHDAGTSAHHHHHHPHEHHHPHPEEKPTPDEDSDVQISGLKLLPAALPAALDAPEAGFVFSVEWRRESSFVDAVVRRAHRARAPPFFSA